MESTKLSPMANAAPATEPGAKQLPIAVPEIKTMLKIIAVISWINLLIGVPSLILVFTVKSVFLFATGILSLLTFWLLRMIVGHIKQSKSWAEVGVIAMCGVYSPAYIMWLSIANLIDAILR